MPHEGEGWEEPSRAGLSIKRITSNDVFGENAYVVYDMHSLEAIIIDPGGAPNEILSFVREKGLSVKRIFATHAHIDHVASVPVLSDQLGSPFSLHRGDVPLLGAMAEQAAAFSYPFSGSIKVGSLLEDGSSYEWGSIRLRVMHTPGHTPGSSCLVVNDDALFTGDTLFAGSIGRTDLPGGSYPQIMASLKRLTLLPDETRVLPGHGEASTIGEEKALNPFLSP